jgi:hypothetical protein
MARWEFGEMGNIFGGEMERHHCTTYEGRIHHKAPAVETYFNMIFRELERLLGQQHCHFSSEIPSGNELMAVTD